MEAKQLKDKLIWLVLCAIIYGLWTTFTDVQAMKVKDPYTSQDIVELKNVTKKLIEAVGEIKTTQAVLDRQIKDQK